MLNENVDQAVAVEIARLRGEVAGNAVPQDGLTSHCTSPTVACAAMQDGAGLGRQDQRQKPPRPRAPGNPLVDKTRSLGRARPRRPDQRPGIAQYLVAYGQALDELLHSR